MKNLISLSVLLIALTFCSCQSATSTPESAAKGFMEAMMALDFEKVEKYCSAEMGEIIVKEMGSLTAAEKEEMKEGIDAAGIKITSVKCVEDGDKAVCTMCCDKKGKSEELNLIKEDGKWLIGDY